MMFCCVADAVWRLAVIGQFGAVEVRGEVVSYVLFLLSRQIIQGVVGNPVVGSVVWLCGVGRVAAVAPANSRLHAQQQN